jgi:hypothetical protein
MNPLHNIETSISKKENTRQENTRSEDRVTISVSRKAYDVLVQHAKQITDKNQETNKPFTIEEILDEEIILLFGNEWNQE